MARDLKFQITEEERFYYLSENKGSDLLRSYHTANLPLRFCICKKQIFSLRDSHVNMPLQYSLIFMAVNIDNFEM